MDLISDDHGEASEHEPTIEAGGGDGPRECAEEAVEHDHREGDAEQAPTRVPVLLRGAAEQLDDGHAAQQLGRDDKPLRILPLRADHHRHVPRWHLPAGGRVDP
jgi:hypothetical protein